MLGPGPMLAVCWTVLGPCWAMLGYTGPCWAPCWAHVEFDEFVGPMVRHVGPMLGVCWAHVGPMFGHVEPKSGNSAYFRPLSKARKNRILEQYSLPRFKTS